MKLLVTGGAGFIGSNFIKYWLGKNLNDKIINLDVLTYAGNLENLQDIKNNKNYKFIKGDIADIKNNKKLFKKERIDIVINFAAESHNGRAMTEPDVFVKTNVLGTQMLLEAARDSSIKRFHHISTCEVFGDLGLNENKKFKENDPYLPKTPYNASKSGANHEVMAYYHTYGLPVTISHCSNNYGPYQFPEKIIPRFTVNALQDKKLPLFKSSKNKREWLHVDDHSRAIELILKKGRTGESYNIGSGVEKSVEEIADIVLEKLNKSNKFKVYVEDRPGHDRRYLLDTRKIKKELNWKPEIGFREGIESVINWYSQNEWWWKPLAGKGFVENYRKV